MKVRGMSQSVCCDVNADHIFDLVCDIQTTCTRLRAAIRNVNEVKISDIGKQSCVDLTRINDELETLLMTLRGL